MSGSDYPHPDHECDDCGKTHMSYTGHLEFIARQKRTRDILIIIVCVSLISVPLGLTVFDMTKNPPMLGSNIDYSLFDIGYDIVCYSEYEMQYCLVDSNASNQISYDSDRLVLHAIDNHICLNVYLSTPNELRNVYLATGGIDCIPSLEFPILNGWSWSDTSKQGKHYYQIVKSDSTMWLEDMYDEIQSFTEQ